MSTNAEAAVLAPDAIDMAATAPAVRPSGRPREETPDPMRAEPAVVDVTVVGSGKGGVGKSVLSVLLAASMARRGARVLMADGSLTQGDLHVLLGVHPKRSLEALVAGEAEPEEMLSSIADRLWLLPGGSGGERLYALDPADRARLQLRRSAIYERFDAVVVDAGAGIEGALRGTIGASRLAVITNPEPASLSEAYALIKLATLRVPYLPIELLVNRASDPEEGRETWQRLETAARRFLGRELPCLGVIGEHPGLRRAVRRPAGLLDVRAADADAIASRILARALGGPA